MKHINAIITFFVVLFIALVFFNLLNVSLPITVTNTTKSTELSVVGEGKVDVVPDTAYIDLGITVNNASSVEDAQKQINTTNNAIVAALAKLGIKKSDIKTSNYSIYPNYSYEGNVNRITGYNGNVNVNIKVTDPQKAADVITAGTAAGANQVNGTQFVVADPAKYRAEARSKAIANAKEQAQKLAKDLGIRLGKVVNIVEYTPDSGAMPRYDMALSSKMGMGGGGNGPEFEQGSQTITSVVTLYFEKR